jgi:hypothetical protein
VAWLNKYEELKQHLLSQSNCPAQTRLQPLGQASAPSEVDSHIRGGAAPNLDADADADTDTFMGAENGNEAVTSHPEIHHDVEHPQMSLPMLPDVIVNVDVRNDSEDHSDKPNTANDEAYARSLAEQFEREYLPEAVVATVKIVIKSTGIGDKAHVELWEEFDAGSDQPVETRSKITMKKWANTKGIGNSGKTLHPSKLKLDLSHDDSFSPMDTSSDLDEGLAEMAELQRCYGGKEQLDSLIQKCGEAEEICRREYDIVLTPDQWQNRETLKINKTSTRIVDSMNIVQPALKQMYRHTPRGIERPAPKTMDIKKMFEAAGMGENERLGEEERGENDDTEKMNDDGEATKEGEFEEQILQNEVVSKTVNQQKAPKEAKSQRETVKKYLSIIRDDDGDDWEVEKACREACDVPPQRFIWK